MSPPTPPPPSGPNTNLPSPGELLNEAQAIRAAETLLTVTQSLYQQPELALLPEFGQKVLLRGELIQAIGQLPFKTFSPETQTQILALLQAAQALDPKVEATLKQQKAVLAEQLNSIPSAKTIQNRYHTGQLSSTRELEG
jgi:hypothetical protein